jgi:predicted ATPase
VYELRLVGTPQQSGAEDGVVFGAPAGTATSNLGWARRAAPRRLVGRTSPIARLRDAWRASLRGERRTILLAGERGIGKTALVAEFALEMDARAAVVLYGRWDHPHRSPYQAISEVVDTYTGDAPAAPRHDELDCRRRELEALVPDVGTRLGDRFAPAAHPSDGEVLAVCEAFAAWLDCLAARSPVLLVLDDLHWAERISGLVVEHLQAVAPRRVMLVATTRHDDAERPGPPGTASSSRIAPDGGRSERIDLDGLGAPEIARLVDQALGCSLAPDHEAIAWLTAATGGNPLVVMDLLHGAWGVANIGAGQLSARRQPPYHELARRVLHDEMRSGPERSSSRSRPVLVR